MHDHANDDKTRRRKTRHRGISYREGRDGRTYSVFHRNTYVARDAAGNLLRTEGAALERQAELRGAKAKGQQPVLPTKTTFADLAESWFEAKARHLRAKTVEQYRSALDLVLLPRFGMRRVSSFTPDDIAILIRDLEREGLHAVDPKRDVRPLGRSSIENYLKPLQSALSLAVRRRLIAANPFDALTSDERPKGSAQREVHIWTEEELERLFAASEDLCDLRQSGRWDPDNNLIDYTPPLRVAASLGLRVGELLGLQWRDFDSDEGRLHIRRQWLRGGVYGPTKTKAGVRSIPLTSDLKLLLLEVRAASRFKGKEDPIFVSGSGRPLSHRNLTRRGFEAARDEAGLPSSLVFHDLRHAAASRLIAAGIDPVAVANVLGHEDPHVTLKVYAHLFNREAKDEQIRAALDGTSR